MAETFPIPFGRYQLVERLAVGGMAELFKATVAGEHGFAKQVVIKRLLPHLSQEPTYNAMFIDEAKLTARLVHPKIAQTYELGRVDELLFIAMEYVNGIDVLAMLRECAHRRQRVPAEVAVWITHEVLDALDFAHNLRDVVGQPLGVVHRDISPSNVLLSVRGDVKLVDFGIARASGPGRAHQTKSGTLKGKYGYMSPEQVVELPLDGRSDLFSVGIVLAEMLIGRRLFAAANELDVLLMVRDARLGRLDRFGADIEPGLGEILRRALKKSVDERWPTAAAFRDALGEWLFEHRYRMTPRHVADVVESLRPAAEARRRKAMAEDGDADAAISDTGPTAIGSGEVSAAGSGPAFQGAVVEAPLDAGDSMPIIQMEAIESGPHVAPTRPPSAPPAGGPPARAATVPARPARVQRAQSVPAMEVVDIDLSDLARDLELDLSLDAAPDPIEDLEPSIRYPSIEAAISALAPVELDPSAIDFDDSEVEGAARSRDIRLPTAEELKAKPVPPPPELHDIDDAPDDAGEFAATPPLGVLYRLITSRATGLLVVSVGGIKKEIYVRDGLPEFVSSNVASELFGSWLVAQHILSQGELAMALAMMPHYGGKLGDTLVGLGLLRPLEVFRQLTRQVRAKLIDVCSWTKGAFSWYAGRENTREAFPLDLNAFEVLGAGAIAMPDDAVASWVERHADDHLRAAKAGRIGPDRFEILGLRAVYDGLDGRRTVGELLERFTDETERGRTARMLILLTECELARPA